MGGAGHVPTHPVEVFGFDLEELLRERQLNAGISTTDYTPASRQSVGLSISLSIGCLGQTKESTSVARTRSTFTDSVEIDSRTLVLSSLEVRHLDNANCRLIMIVCDC